MAYRCPHYLCVASSIEGLIQQIALSYLRHGYWWYVTGIIPDRKASEEVDHNILTKYGIRKDWRYVAHNKQRGIANLQYIRFERFYVIMATKGLHEFKQRETKRIRDARKCPLLVPWEMNSIDSRFPRVPGTGIGRQDRVFDGYAISYRRGGYLRKSPEDKAAYLDAIQHWREQTALGRDLPKPPKGRPDPNWHSCVEIERQSYLRLRAYLLDIATHRSVENLSYEFTQTGYVPYQPVKRQLVRIIKDVNLARSRAGSADHIAYRDVLRLRRLQVHPFTSDEQHHRHQVGPRAA